MQSEEASDQQRVIKKGPCLSYVEKAAESWVWPWSSEMKRVGWTSSINGIQSLPSIICAPHGPTTQYRLLSSPVGREEQSNAVSDAGSFMETQHPQMSEELAATYRLNQRLKISTWGRGQEFKNDNRIIITYSFGCILLKFHARTVICAKRARSEGRRWPLGMGILEWEVCRIRSSSLPRL